MDVMGPDGTVRRRELDTVVTRAMISRSEVSMAVGPRLAARPRQAISSRPVAPGPPFVRITQMPTQRAADPITATIHPARQRVACG